jgi:gluconolactonase
MRATSWILSATLLLTPLALHSADEYPLGPDSQRQAGVPQGKVSKHTWTSKIFPGTVRDYWVYVPAQYKPDKPAPVMIVQDGGGFVTDEGRWRAHIVFDNLIAKGQMPPVIGIFINPGVLPARSENEQARFNRAFEYDALGGRYARFLLEEILPEVGKQYNLSSDPNDRAIAGSSSGGIASFTAAWNRPDAFRRVMSFVGSYANLRGGAIYPSLIRKTEPKPLRVFLQDGRNDQNIYGGNWFIANQDMYSALTYAGYDTTFVIGTEGHNNKHGSAILPDALRWLWRDYPAPVPMPKGEGEREYVTMLLDPGRNWEVVSQGHKFTEGPAVDRSGNVFFSDIPNNRIHKISTDGKVSVFKEDTGGANGLMFGPDGRLYACQNGRKRIVAYAPDGTESVLAEGVGSNDLAVSSRGEIYFTDPAGKKVWFIDRNGSRRPVISEGIAFPNGVRLSPDQSLLDVADYADRWIWSFQVQPDGSLSNGERFHRLETDDEASAKPDGMAVDSEGELWVATTLGVQICDQAGRVIGIVNKPQPGPLSNVVFGGADLRTLYVTSGDKVFRRAVRRKGIYPWMILTPPKPRL